MSEAPIFNRLALIGFGLIGGSIARAARAQGVVRSIVATARSPKTRKRIAELGAVDQVVESNAAAVSGADLVIVCIPVGASGEVAKEIGTHLMKGATVSDVGRSINRLQVTMQDEGAAIMGLGHTLMEHYIFDTDGRIRNLGAIDYRIPTSMDLPLEMVSDTVENGDGPGPYGAKGMSEGALLAVSSAVAAAVRDATGVAIRDLPLSPERVWRAIRESDTQLKA